MSEALRAMDDWKEEIREECNSALTELWHRNNPEQVQTQQQEGDQGGGSSNDHLTQKKKGRRKEHKT